jgi:hypothetical protein
LTAGATYYGLRKHLGPEVGKALGKMSGGEKAKEIGKAVGTHGIIGSAAAGIAGNIAVPNLRLKKKFNDEFHEDPKAKDYARTVGGYAVPAAAYYGLMLKHRKAVGEQMGKGGEAVVNAVLKKSPKELLHSDAAKGAAGVGVAMEALDKLSDVPGYLNTPESIIKKEKDNRNKEANKMETKQALEIIDEAFEKTAGFKNILPKAGSKIDKLTDTLVGGNIRRAELASSITQAGGRAVDEAKKHSDVATMAASEAGDRILGKLKGHVSDDTMKKLQSKKDLLTKDYAGEAANLDKKRQSIEHKLTEGEKRYTDLKAKSKDHTTFGKIGDDKIEQLKSSLNARNLNDNTYLGRLNKRQDIAKKRIQSMGKSDNPNLVKRVVENIQNKRSEGLRNDILTKMESGEFVNIKGVKGSPYEKHVNDYNQSIKDRDKYKELSREQAARKAKSSAETRRNINKNLKRQNENMESEINSTNASLKKQQTLHGVVNEAIDGAKNAVIGSSKDNVNKERLKTYAARAGVGAAAVGTAGVAAAGVNKALSKNSPTPQNKKTYNPEYRDRVKQAAEEIINSIDK